MKGFNKKAVALLVCAGVLVGGALIRALEDKDSLITLNYLKNDLIPGAVSQGLDRAVPKMDEVYESASEALKYLADSYLYQMGAGENGGYSEGSVRRTCGVRDVMTLQTGSGVILEAGRVLMNHTGAVINVTTGESVPSGSLLAVNCRYLVAEDTQAELTVESDAARLAVEGIFTVTKSGEKATPFTDITIHDSYRDAINEAYSRGLFAGMGDGSVFSPDEKLNRAMMMTVLFHLAGDPDEERFAATATFLDVKEGQWYESYVRWAAQQGISAGYGDGNFRPTQTMTYREVVQFLYNFARSYLKLQLTERADLNGKEGVDVLRSDGWGEEAMSWAMGAGLIDRLRPNECPARSDVAVIMAAFAQKYFPKDAPAG